MSETLTLSTVEGAEELRDAVRELLAARTATIRDVLSRADVTAWGESAWRGLAEEIGVTGIAVAEEHGGAGGGWGEAAVVVEELGRSVADVPFLTSSGIAAALLERLGADEDLAALAGGRVYAVAVPWTAPLDVAHLDDAGDALTPVSTVAGALEADVLLVPARGRVVAVDAADATVRPVVSFDMTRPLADISFDGATGRVLGTGPAADAAVDHAGLIGLVLLASEQLGVAEAALDSAVDYVKTRHQFGRAIGSYQAIKHRLADLWSEILTARAAARYAAACAAADATDLPVAASLAATVCSRVAVHAAEELVQMHGGIGFTWEHPAHIHLKRARADALALGGVAWHRHRLGDLVDL
jgi:alkylation response protein AidB-like acyl-CoA dehydrogenase